MNKREKRGAKEKKISKQTVLEKGAGRRVSRATKPKRKGIQKMLASRQPAEMEKLGVSFKKLASSFSGIHSHDLDKTIITGDALNGIAEALKTFDLKLEELLDASQSTLYREYKKDDIDIAHKDHLVSIMRVMEKGLQAFEDEDDFNDWLNAKIENLGDRKPIEMLHLETGRREVEQALDRIEYGVYG
ncbi:antitoxin Xre/MbcA/ParS toxin-binding domain-containing protein [Catalinimonas sp. 4WD22]|uniref:antitoxin Xre/MbcA/ParS toxin-binding domain-containing protein n=1 Tax=Catalinimonas locisalis TaxID=3133978 RepID=UPI00310108AB